MAIPFLQPEEDESARHHGANGPNTASAHAGVGAGAGSSGTGSASASGSGAVVVGGAGSSSGGAVMLAGATGPLPVPNSPAAPIISSGTSTAVQTPLIGPMNSDQLVQLFYEALYRYSRGDTPSTPISQSPQSSSCSPFTTGYYNSGGGGSAGYANATTTGQVFFPQTPNGVFRPGGGGGGIGSYGATTGVFFGQPPTPSPSGSSSHSQHSANSPDTAACSSAPPIIHQFPSSYPLPSTSNASTATNWTHVSSGDGDDSSESDSSQPSSVSDGDSITAPIAGCSPHCLGLLGPPNHHLHQLLDAAAAAGSGSSTGVSSSFNNGSNSSSSSNSAGGSSAMVPMSGCIPPHLDYMAGREQLQEFAGKIPQRKKKSSSSKSSNKSKKSKFLEQTLVWPTLAVTATLIALGCGLLAAR